MREPGCRRVPSRSRQAELSPDFSDETISIEPFGKTSVERLSMKLQGVNNLLALVPGG